MKKSSEVQGLPIISIADGVEVGRVKSLIINPEKRSIDFITVDHEEWQMEGKAVPFNKIIGIGDYALTIDNESSVIDMNEIPVANQLLNRKTKIEQTRLMTKKGQLIGEATGYSIDDETGEIIEISVSGRHGLFNVDGQYVVTYGKDLIIVTEEAAAQELAAKVAQAEPDAAPQITVVPKTVQQTQDTAPSKAKQADEQEKNFADSADTASRWLQQIDDQQTKLLKGKKVTKDIKAGDKILIPAGTVLNEEEIQKVREAGPELLVEISMNSEA